MDVDDAVEYIAAAAGAADDPPDEVAEAVAIALLHTHLPRLRDAGVVAVDREEWTLEARDRFDAATSLLEAV